MTLSEAIEALRPELATYGGWYAMIITRDTAGDGEIVARPIIGVAADEEDREINLLTSQEEEVDQVMTLQGLVEQLDELPTSFGDYGMYSASAWSEAGDSWEYRVDAPLIGFARNDEAEIFGFLEGPEDQWEGS